MKNVFTLAFILFCACSFGQKRGNNLKGKQLLDWVEKVNESQQSNHNSRVLQSRLIAASYPHGSCVNPDSTRYIYKTNSGGFVLFNIPQANEIQNDQGLLWAADSIIDYINDSSCTLSIEPGSSAKQTIANNRVTESFTLDGQYRTRLSYNADNLTTDYFADSILPNATWGEVYHYQFSYNTNKKMTAYVAQYKQGANWQNEYQGRFIYNGNNDLVQAIDESWDSGLNAWSKENETNIFYVSAGIKSFFKDKSFISNDSSYTFFTYAGSLIQKDSSINSNDFVNINQYTYNGSNKIIKKIHKTYKIGQQNFQDTTFTTYNGYGQKLTEWQGAAKHYLQRWYWEEYNGPSAIEEVAAVSEIKFYPNPAAENATLSYSLKSNENVSISLSDITGRVVQNILANKLQSEGTHKLDINLESIIPAGTYFLQIKSEHINSTLKVVKW